MSILKNIKNIISNFYLKLELQDFAKEQKPNKFNIKNVETVGILFDATKAEDLELVKKYVNALRDNRKKLKVIGFFDTKEIHNMTYSKLEYDFISHKELNLLGKPTDAFIENFMEDKLDLLIDLNINDHFPLRYIAALSKATFKVGKFSEKDKAIYDLMIDIDNIEGDKAQPLKYFLKQVDTYLAMINKN
jgi:hypothetical protein